MGNDISRTSDILLVALIAMDVVDNSFYSVLGKRNRSGNIDNFFKLHYVCTP